MCLYQLFCCCFYLQVIHTEWMNISRILIVTTNSNNNRKNAEAKKKRITLSTLVSTSNRTLNIYDYICTTRSSDWTHDKAVCYVFFFCISFREDKKKQQHTFVSVNPETHWTLKHFKRYSISIEHTFICVVYYMKSSIIFMSVACLLSFFFSITTHQFFILTI